MNSKFVPAALRYFGVAMAFAICGALSAMHLLSPGYPPSFPNVLPKMLPVPFALLCALLFTRTARGTLAAPLMVAVWPIAFSVAKYLGIRLGPRYVLSPICAGGLIGGLGLVLCASACYGRLLSPRHFLSGGVIGCFSAVAFASWLNSVYLHLNSYRPEPPFRAFAIWQAAVGTHLYVICTETCKEAQLERLKEVS